jgi:hypothetical protein
MLTVAAIFKTRQDAESTMQQLKAAGFRHEDLVVLAPGASQNQVESVPTEYGEQPGMGKAIGSVVGGAIGLAGGAVVANLLLPGVGPIVAIGLGAGALGIGGAVAGGATGGALENLLSRGLPKDELFLYEDALQQQRSVLIVASEDQDQIDRARRVMDQNGAESIDAAREKWWIGLRDAEEAEYAAPPENFKNNELVYRRGFEAALEPRLRGKAFKEASSSLREEYRDICEQDAFRRGYERGQRYLATRGSETEGRRKTAG